MRTWARESRRPASFALLEGVPWTSVMLLQTLRGSEATYVSAVVGPVLATVVAVMGLILVPVTVLALRTVPFPLTVLFSTKEAKTMRSCRTGPLGWPSRSSMSAPGAAGPLPA